MLWSKKQGRILSNRRGAWEKNEMSEEFIYLDNAATTWPKPEQVYIAVDKTMREIYANPGRSSHHMSLKSERVIGDARLAVARFLNAPSPKNVVFTLNCTDSLNIILKGLIKPGDRVVTGPYEHNSVMRPLRTLQKSGVSVAVARGTGDFSIDLDSFGKLCKEDVNYAVVSHVSNVTGTLAPVREIAEIVHEKGGIFILDAAQSAGIIDIDMQQLGVDVIAAPGHKGLMGPMGVGILVLGQDISVQPFREGGTGIKSEEDSQPDELPLRLEAGTANLPGIAGLLAGIRCIESIGVNTIAEHERKLARRLVDGLKMLDGVRLYCDPMGPQTGVVSFTLESMDATLVGTILDQAFNIGVRTGLHCAPAAHKTIGTFPAGTVRVSFGYYNKYNHVERLICSLYDLTG
jgi:cysteine desulfurase/selenocysteine lyase